MGQGSTVVFQWLCWTIAIASAGTALIRAGVAATAGPASYGRKAASSACSGYCAPPLPSPALSSPLRQSGPATEQLPRRAGGPQVGPKPLTMTMTTITPPPVWPGPPGTIVGGRTMATVSDFVVQRVREWGVEPMFGFPGDGIGEFDGALGRPNAMKQV